jgi:hypothetical protein
MLTKRFFRSYACYFARGKGLFLLREKFGVQTQGPPVGAELNSRFKLLRCRAYFVTQAGVFDMLQRLLKGLPLQAITWCVQSRKFIIKPLNVFAYLQRKPNDEVR